MSSYHIVIKTGRWLRKRTARNHIIDALGDTHYSRLRRISRFPQIWQLDFSKTPWGIGDSLRKLAVVRAVYVDYHPAAKHEDDDQGEIVPYALDPDNSKSRFLSLPAELRNEIYRLVLVEDKRLNIKKDLPTQPGLLRACRQTRQEGLDIYLQDNYFVFYINHFDASTYLQWCRASRKHIGCHHGFVVANSANWDNLLDWLEAYYHGECKGTTVQNEASRMGEVAACMFNLMRVLRDYREVKVGDLTWETFERMFGEVKRALEATNDVWG